eukprot:6184924-Pleurochrysis_carterae.AAC.1
MARRRSCARVLAASTRWPTQPTRAASRSARSPPPTPSARARPSASSFRQRATSFAHSCSRRCGRADVLPPPPQRLAGCLDQQRHRQAHA